VKTTMGALAVAFVSIFGLHGSRPLRSVPGFEPAARPSGIEASSVVVELFTSEGCSSCPPADALLAKLEADQSIPQTRVIALEEHVDYWNDLGWVDPFSGRNWTLRQQNYAGSLGNGNPYTPQMVVDGRTELVGSRERQALQAIAKAAKEPKTEVLVRPRPAAGPHTARWDVSVGRIDAAGNDTAEVWLAVTEAGLHSSVTAGENSGHELAHASVVRWLQKIGVATRSVDSSFSQAVTEDLKAGWNRQHLSAVVFVQEKKSRHILGATLVPVEP
jgi:hypothetical protein